MPDSITLTPRKIFLEDLSTTTNASGATASVTVLGTGAVTLNKLALVLLTQFTQAASDAAAAGAGVNLGQIYYNTTDSKLHARLT